MRDVTDLPELYKIDTAMNSMAFYGDAAFSKPNREGFMKYCRNHFPGVTLYRQGIRLTPKEANELIHTFLLGELWDKSDNVNAFPTAPPEQ